MLPLCISVVFLVKIRVNGYREMVKKTTHIILLSFTTIHLLFFIKRKKTELAIYSQEEKWGHELPTDRAKIF